MTNENDNTIGGLTGKVKLEIFKDKYPLLAVELEEIYEKAEIILLHSQQDYNDAKNENKRDSDFELLAKHHAKISNAEKTKKTIKELVSLIIKEKI